MAQTVPSAVVSTPDKAVATKAPSGVIQRLATGQNQDLIVLFDDTQIQNQVSNLRQQAAAQDSPNVLNFKATQYTNLKQQVLSGRSANEVEVLRDYSHLPMAFVRFRSPAALTGLLQRSEVVRVYQDEKRERLLSQSLPVINQPAVASAGKRGSGTTVVVIDSGVNYTSSAFGFCNSPGQPAGCKVVYSQDFGHNDGNSGDSDQHGTNVAGIVVGVAPDTRIAALDVFPNGEPASDSAIFAAINWSIQNKAAYNIVAMNLSLGGSVKNTSICSSSSYATPFANARAAGIIPVVAAGNEGYTNGLSSPACAPGAVSVGAVYDTNLGSLNWGTCADTTTATNKVTCFSNSANFLTLLAPGAIITAAGVSQGGTSQATPHVAGAVAVLRASNAFPGDTVAQTIARMTSTGSSVSDPKNGIVKPRLNLLAATSGNNNQPPPGLVPRGDFNNDGKTDILWRRDNGYLVAWLMNGTTLINGINLSPNQVSDTAWKVVGPR